jgi:CubicO group peptidase (beta-lactamase class C family)
MVTTPREIASAILTNNDRSTMKKNIVSRSQNQWAIFAASVSLSLAAGSAISQELEFELAARLQFETLPGSFHTLESSEDLETWTPRITQLGDGNPSLTYLSMAGLPRQFFRVSSTQPESLDARLDEIRESHGLPGLAAICLRDGSVVSMGVAGNRRTGTESPLTIQDKFHLGSVTKSMTSTLAAVLVEEGVISWDTTLGEVFPEQADQMQGGYSSVTLEQLLVHRGGTPSDLELNPSADWRAVWEILRENRGTPVDQRLTLLAEVTSRAPESVAGTEFLYSNVGYAFAGAMFERVTGKSWETLISEKVFRPLEMGSAGFGSPATPQYIDQPLGHVWEDGAFVPVESGILGDNPPGIAPAATVHCSLPDLARFLSLHLQSGGLPVSALGLSQSTIQRLHTPIFPEDNYSLGWFSTHKNWAGGTILQTNGTNLSNLILVIVAPTKNFVLVVATNSFGDNAIAASLELIDEIIATQFP